MLKNEMVARNPLRSLDQSQDGGLVPGQMGLVVARAGTGKTAFLIQVALDNIFRGNPVLHVSIGETVSHVKAWYDEIFRDLATGYDLERAREVWEEVEQNRFIMTFRVDVFDVVRLEERLEDLVQQGIFRPKVVLVDKLDLAQDPRPVLEALGRFAREKGLKVWVSARSHREKGDLAEWVAPYQDIFQVVVGLEPKADSVNLRLFKNPSGNQPGKPISLNTKTLLLTANGE